jgi:hypothetical protein
MMQVLIQHVAVITSICGGKLRFAYNFSEL